MGEQKILEDSLKQGEFLKKDCWLKPMHIRYNPSLCKIELVDSVATSSGERILGVRESYDSLEAIPYAGKWIRCTEKGELIDGDN